MSNATENELLEREARARGLSVTQYLMLKATPDSLMRDLMSDARRGISNSASMLPPQPSKPVTKGTGWVNAPPIRSPADKSKYWATSQPQTKIPDGQVKIHQQIAEMQREEEIEQQQRDRELDPYDTGLYDK
jgi:hypothetical protein